MGNCTAHSKNFYSSKYSEENNICEWESKLGFDNLKFRDIVIKLNTIIILDGEEISQKKLELFLRKIFNDNNVDISTLFKDEYFKKNKKIDTKAIKLLFLLLCPNDIKSNYDKVEWIFDICGTDQENEDENKNLKLVIEKKEVVIVLAPLFDFSLEIIPSTYISTLKEGVIPANEKYLSELAKTSSAVKIQWLNELFQNKDSMLIEDFNNNIEKNIHLFTPGYIREIAITIMKSQTPH